MRAYLFLIFYSYFLTQRWGEMVFVVLDDAGIVYDFGVDNTIFLEGELGEGVCFFFPIYNIILSTSDC